jgi:type VI secretion system protein ImpE
VQPGPGFKGGELGEVLLPVLAPGTWQHENDAVRLGRMTEWRELPDDRAVPIGHKLLIVDDEEFPLLEVRELEFTPVPSAAR